MPDERDLVDTNVLVYALYEEDDHHEASRSLLDRAQNDEAVLCIAAQIMAELYAVITDSRRVSSPFDPSDAADAIDRFLAMPNLTVLPTPVDLVTR